MTPKKIQSIIKKFTINRKTSVPILENCAVVDNNIIATDMEKFICLDANWIEPWVYVSIEHNIKTKDSIHEFAKVPKTDWDLIATISQEDYKKLCDDVKYMKNIVKKKNYNAILTGIYFRWDCIIGTDTMCLYKKYTVKFKKDFILPIDNIDALLVRENTWNVCVYSLWDVIFFSTEYWYTWSVTIKWKYPNIEDDRIMPITYDEENIKINLSKEIEICKALKMDYIHINKWVMNEAHKTDHDDIEIRLSYAKLMNGYTFNKKWDIYISRDVEWWTLVIRG